MHGNLPKTHLQEAKLLERAIDAFRAATGLQIEVEPQNEALYDHPRKIDALVRLRTPDIDQEFAVELKMGVTDTTLGAMTQRLTGLPQQQMLVTHFVNPRMAERLKQMDIPFIDTAGNAYLNVPPVFIFIKGNRPPERPEKVPLTRAFQPTGLRVVFAFLCHPALVNAPYRDIAREAHVALGTVAWVVTNLKGMGYLLDKGKRGRRLVNRKKLLDRWVTAYPERLRPKLLIGRFRTTQTDWWKDALLTSFRAYWGGEVAAKRLTQYLKPEMITIYAREPTAQLQLNYRLRKDPEGNIELLRAFWDVERDWVDPEMVPPLLVYADLLATGDPRNIETAKLVYERELTGLIRED
ncbi:MAG: hypothetical protein IH919_06090 [Deltaproteobacteria bacterium]|nr:hypothetical protein [Deltaproteobacteria bacterium]